MIKPSKARVLIVEDEPDIAGLMKHALERGGDLEVEHVGTGAAALKAVMEEPPSLVLLDLNLPFIDGLEVCRLLRGRPASAVSAGDGGAKICGWVTTLSTPLSTRSDTPYD